MRLHPHSHTSFPRPNTVAPYHLYTPLPPSSQPRSSLKPSHWSALLQHYPDSRFPSLLHGIATHGARVGYRGPLLRIRSRNHPSVLRIPSEITENIHSELALGRIQPVHCLPQFYVISPLGAVPKLTNGIQTGWRRIHDLSFPAGSSVNDGISPSYASLLYQTIDDAIALISKAGQNTILRKRDFKDAFRTIPISPLDYWLLCFEWDGSLYVDIFLPFGLRTSPFIFNLFAEGFHWIMESVFSRSLVHYLDDFLFIDEPDPNFFGALASFLGFTERIDKRQDGTIVEFLGLILDSYNMIVTLPENKHRCALLALHTTLSQKTISHRSLEKLLGFLSFCARVIPLGRPFLRNLFNLLRKFSHRPAMSRSRLSSPAKRDLQWWTILLPLWSRVRLIQPSRPRVHLYTDASGSKGIGGWWSSSAFSARIPRRYRQKLIDWKEAYAVLFAFAKWSTLWHGHTVVVHCDNSAIVSAISSRSIRGHAIDPLQLLFLASATQDIELISEWISSQANWIADALSRFQLHLVANLFSQFQNDFPRHRESGSIMSAFLLQLQNSFGMVSLPELDHPTPSPCRTTVPLLPSTTSRHSQRPPKRSASGQPKHPLKRRRQQYNDTSQVSAATTSILVSPPQSLQMNGLNALLQAHDASI